MFVVDFIIYLLISGKYKVCLYGCSNA